MDEIRWGIIGCGDVTEVKSGPGFQQADGSSLVAVMRRNGPLAQDYARRHNVPYWFDNAQSVIDHPEVDAVYIATPPGSHLDYARKVLAAGKPAYIEKPMARNAAECEEMTDTFEAAGLPLFVAYYRRALPRFLKAKEIVESGGIGKVTGLSYQFTSPSHRTVIAGNLPWRWSAEEAGGGQFLDLGCHTLDILDFIVGPLQAVSGSAVNAASDFDVEDGVAMQFRLESGGLGVAAWNFAGAFNEDKIEITGTNGRITLSTFGNEPVVMELGSDAVMEALPSNYYGGTKGSITVDRQSILYDLPNPKHIQQPFIETINAALRGKGACASTGQSALRTARIIDTVLDSYYGGRQDAFWERPDTWPGRRSGR